MALYLGGKKIVNSLVVDGRVNPERLYILDPDKADEQAGISTQTQGTGMASFIPYISKIQNDATMGTPNMGGKQTFGGSSQACIFRNGYEVGGVQCVQKIPHGVYKKLYVNCQVTAYGTGWIKAYLSLSRSLGFTSSGTASNTIKSIILVDNDKTSTEINNQTGVVINSTNSSLLSAQVVEVDVSAITQDFYFGFWNCDRNIAIRSIYLE